MKIYPIIVTYNGMKWIDRCLESLRRSTVPLHTIVIDNQSADGTAQHITTHYPEVELICSAENLGFGKGNNIGLQRAVDDGADYVFLLNQDAWINPDAVEILVDAHQKNKEYGVLSPVHLNFDDDELEYYFRTIIGEHDCPGFIANMYSEKLNDIYPIHFIHAAAWLISRECLIDVGGFNPLFPHYCEDLEYVNRVKFHHHQIGVVPKSIVHHLGTHGALNKDLSVDFYFQYYFTLVELLNPKFKLRAISLIKIKMSIDKITSALLFRRWKEIHVQWKLILKIIGSISNFHRNRISLKKRSAFLNLK